MEVSNSSEYTFKLACETIMRLYLGDCQLNLNKAITILSGIERGEAEGLIQALTVQIGFYRPLHQSISPMPRLI
jgi:hypothetical protein